jgi:hypothetical protein
MSPRCHFIPKDDVQFQDRSPNGWLTHPATVRLQQAHKVVTVYARQQASENAVLRARVAELEKELAANANK